MSVSAAISPMGLCSLIIADASPPAPVQLSKFTPGPNQVEVVNQSTTVTAYLAYGATAAEATANAVLPVVGTPSKVVPIPPGSDKMYSLPPNAFYTGIASAPAILNLMPGDGV